MQNLPESRLPVVLVDHNIEYLIYDRFVKRAPFFLQPFLSLDVAKIKREEEESWKKATKVIAVSEDDKKVMQQHGVIPEVVPNGVNIQQFTLKDSKKVVDEKEKKLLFIGDFKWIQNKDTVKFIIEEVWPKINLKLKTENSKLDVKLWIVGREIPDSIRQLTDDPSVVFDEQSSALPTEQIFQKANVLLSPIRVGGGTSYKILESMSCGTPVVTMQLSADSIQAKDGEELIVGQTAKELAEKTLLLLQDHKTYEKISKKGRDLIEKKYSWKEITKNLEAVYKNAYAILNS
jgi:glycosyltransferase involved in cell wall biosynthesis